MGDYAPIKYSRRTRYRVFLVTRETEKDNRQHRTRKKRQRRREEEYIPTSINERIHRLVKEVYIEEHSWI
jgi:hypothetical protein